jgi:hypothetical protein
MAKKRSRKPGSLCATLGFTSSLSMAAKAAAVDVGEEINAEVNN